MKDKKVRDALILGGAVVLLIIVASFSLKDLWKSPAQPPAQPAQTATGTPPAAGSSADASPAEKVAQKADGSNTVTWLNTKNVPNLVAEVSGGRDPFKDLQLPKMPVMGSTTPNPLPTPAVTGRTDMGLPPTGSNGMPMPAVEVEKHLTKTLAWISPQVLAKQLDDEALDVTLKSGARANQVVLTGYSPDFEKAVEIINKNDVAPPIPPFVCIGVITSPGTRIAVITLDGKQYNVYEGEAIPRLGWTVTRITATGVSLSKGRQAVQLRLSGGSTL